MKQTALATLGTLFGLQALRAFLPLLVYVLRDRAGLPTATLGGIAAAVFAASFLMPPLVARLGLRRALPIAVLTLAIVRSLLQVASDHPVAALGLSAMMVVGFGTFLAALSRDPEASPATGVLLGGFLDVVIHAVAGTRDLHWGGTFSDLGTWVLVGVAAFVSLHLLRAEDSSDEPRPLSAGLGLLAWGPFLFMHLEQLGNVARLSARSGFATGVSGMIVALGLAVALGFARHLPRTGIWAGAPVLLLAVLFFGRGLLWSAGSGPLSVAPLVVAQLAGAALLARAVSGRRPAGSTALDALCFGTGFVLLFAFVFGHYAGYDLPLPFSRTAVFLAAAAALLAAAILAPGPAARVAPRVSFAGIAALAVLATVPLARPFLSAAFTTVEGPRPEARPGHVAVGEPIRAVSFNLHNGFDEKGGFALDEMLLALRREDADIVALQEVSRGWLINGAADLFELSREALGLSGVPGPSVTADWGNAVFTRWPASASRLEPLPPDRLRLPRSVLLVDLEAPEDETRQIRILATHWHQVNAEHAIRNEQARFIARNLGAPSDTMPSLLLGDFNALPDSECMAILAEAGWRDVFSVTDDAMTNPSDTPRRRIDTILTRGPWRLLRAEAAPPWGSDHRAVVAELLLERRGLPLSRRSR